MATTFTNATDYIAENGDHISDDSLAAIEQIPDSAFSRVCELAREFSNWNIGLDCEAAITHETIADFQSSRKNSWAESGHAISEGDDHIAFTNVQLVRGQQRRDILVIDLGDKRLALSL